VSLEWEGAAGLNLEELLTVNQCFIKSWFYWKTHKSATMPTFPRHFDDDNESQLPTVPKPLLTDYKTFQLQPSPNLVLSVQQQLRNTTENLSPSPSIGNSFSWVQHSLIS
jgi:hypothetical protein